ncbi:MAG: hypothetical protein ACKVH8_23050 [Pirellulales bacterium]
MTLFHATKISENDTKNIATQARQWHPGLNGKKHSTLATLHTGKMPVAPVFFHDDSKYIRYN